MSYMDWSNKFSVKNKEIDDQHKKLFDMINKLHSSVTTDGSRAVAIEIIDGLLEYVEYHFSTEEAYLKQNAYPKYEDHCNEHRDLAQKTVDFLMELKANDKISPSEIMLFLKDWLEHHILVIDMHYCNFISSLGKTS